MRVLHLIQRYSPARGGAEKHLEEISNYLAAAGHEVTVVTTDSLDFEVFWDARYRRISGLEDRHQGVDIQRFTVRHLPISRLAYPGLRRLLALLSRVPFVPTELLLRISQYTPWVPDLWKWTKETDQRYDIVAGMTIGFEPIMAAGQTYARRVGAPFVCYPLTHFGAGPAPGDDPVSRYYTLRHQTAVVLMSDLVIAQTPTEQNYYEERGLSGENFLIGGPGVNPSQVLGGDGKKFAERFGIENPLILFIGYLSSDKGAFDTLEAGLLLKRQGYDVDLAFIGTISSSFQDRFDRLNDSERIFIHLLGPVDDSVKRDALAAASVLSMPSRTDSFGITYLEAWLYGVPVIAARTWGVTDVVDHGTDGLVVSFGDVNALAAALSTILDNPNDAKNMGERGRSKVYQTHLWETKLSAIEEVYQRLILEKAGL